MNVIEAAKEASWPVFLLAMLDGTEDLKRLERFAQIIRNQALEDAAKCCEHVTWEGCWKQAATNRAHAIRSMKKDQPCQ